MNELYKEDFYLSRDYDYVINKKITEYDMKDAGFNLIKYYRLLPNDKIVSLEYLDKASRKIAIGNIMRQDREFSIKETEAFGLMRKLFMEENELEQSDILSIKKDAIFVVKKRCKHTEFGNVSFIAKNIYSSYHKFDKLELYYSSDKNILDVKGINDSNLYKHDKTIKFLKHLFMLLENNDHDEFVEIMKDFINDYKNRNLDYRYYREFNSDSSFVLSERFLSLNNYSFGLDGYKDIDISKLDISYNYLNLYLPMIQRYYFNGFRTGNVK